MKTKMPGRVTAAALAALAAMMLLPGALGDGEARADGIYVPERAVKATPRIPTQRAILAYRDGEEKLVIESALDSEGQSFGWIVPVPARPTAFRRVSPGLLKTMSLAMGPDITHDLGASLSMLVPMALVVTLWALLVLLDPRRTRQGALVYLLAMIFVWFLATGLLMTASLGGGAVANPAPGATVEDALAVGSYDVSVLRCETPAALDAWCDSNGFARLPEAGRGIVADYISEGWRFVAARLRREGGEGAGGLSVPHPISITFPTERPVYPMRLTALSGVELYLELFVVAEGTARSDALTLEVTDRYRLDPDLERDSAADRDLPGFAAENHYGQIGHPDAQSVLWGGCTVSKLAGTLSPSEMHSDIRPEIGASEFRRRRLFSRPGAAGTALVVALIGWTALVLFQVLVRFDATMLMRARPAALLLLGAKTAGVLAAAGAVLYLAVPKVEVRTGRWIDQMYAHTRVHQFACLFEERRGAEWRTPEEFAAAFEKHLAENGETNRLAGGPLRAEDSPGNFTVSRDGDEVILTAYDARGFPKTLVLREGVMILPEEKPREEEDGGGSGEAGEGHAATPSPTAREGWGAGLAGPSITKTPGDIRRVFATVEKAQETYFERDRDGDGVLEYAPSLAELASRGLLAEEIARAQDVHPRHRPYRGYVLSVKRRGLVMNACANWGWAWLLRSAAENREQARPFEESGDLTRGFGLVARPASPEPDPPTHCLALGVTKGSTSPNHLSLLIGRRELDYVPYWISWVVCE